MEAGQGYRENVTTPEGRELGAQMARLCDKLAVEQGRDGRCATCAFRAGDHLANGSPETLMTALKCAIERAPFWCHEHDQPCAGWRLMRFENALAAPWEAVDGVDAIDHIIAQGAER